MADLGNCKAPYYTDGSPSSGLSLFSNTYSNNGGSTYVYAAPADAEGANTVATHLKSSLSGSFLPQSGASAPSFTVKFRVILE